MSKDKEINDEEGREDLFGDRENSGEKGMLAEDVNYGLMCSSHSPPHQKVRLCETNQSTDLNYDGFCSSEGKLGYSSGAEPQDADYSYIPSLSNELEVLILARVPREEHWKFYLLNKYFLQLLRNGELFKIRREIGLKESTVFMLPMGDRYWWAFDGQFKSWRKLPRLPADDCFRDGDKESISAGSHLIVSGKEMEGTVVWRFELETNRWYRGPGMINPRCLFASATCGTYAFVAGGKVIGFEGDFKVVDSAEKYNPETKSWHPLPRMHRQRELCSGCFMDNKFYVIGGKNEKGNYLTCGEAYDNEKGLWELIPNMLEGIPLQRCQSPPLIAVVNNELYSLETLSNELRLYLKSSKTWKNLGPVPFSAGSAGGWGVAFKSLGKELLVIGPSFGGPMPIYTCCPQPDADELKWTHVECDRCGLNQFILNCCVMVA
ncbi:hypothetical protein SLE2022_195090 [Rubroshorea leprosula]